MFFSVFKLRIFAAMKKNQLVALALCLLPLGACNYNGGDFPTPVEGSVILSPTVSNQRINGFAEDKQGHIWMATLRGLDCYIGHEFQQFFCTDDETGLPDNQINDVIALQDGRLCVVTVNGVAFTTDQGHFHRVPIESSSKNFSTVLETRSGKLLLSNNSSLYCYFPDQDAILPVFRELNAFGARPMVLDREDRLWVISDAGFTVKCYRTQDWNLLTSTRINFQAYHIADAQDGTLWLSGMGRLGILDATTLEWQPLPKAIREEKRLMEGDIDILFPIDANQMLLNVIGKGFFLYQKNLDKVLYQEDPDFPYTIPDAEVRTLFQDSRRNLWMGTTDKGFEVSYYLKGLFSGKRPLVNAFKGKTVTSLCTDRNGDLWITTLMDGLWLYRSEDGHIQKVETDFLIPDNTVGYVRPSRVFCDSAGEIWLLFSDKMRVSRCSWDGKRLKQLDFRFIQNPMSITEDDQGHIWIGGFSPNIQRYDKTTREVTNHFIGTPQDWTYVPEMTMLEPGRLEVACFNQSPTIMNTYTLEAKQRPILDKEQAATIKRSVIIPTRLLKDSAGDLWLGTISNGLIFVDGTTGKRTSMEDLPCMDICSIEEDRQGNIWVSTMNGLAKYDRTTRRFIHFLETDGTGGDQYSERASCMLPDGTLVFGGTHGLTCFNPLDAPGKRVVPIVFEYLTIHNQLVAPSDNGPINKVLQAKPDILIRNNENAFDVNFTAVDYSEYEQIRYAYKLEGFDKDWVRINTRHNAYFSNVPPGRYKLRVTIANGSHTISETEESLNIRILPPWHRSWWACILWVCFGLLLLGIAVSFVRHMRRVRKEAARRIWQVRREREKAEEAQKAEKELNKIQMNYFSNVAHEFRTPLTMIAGPAQQLSDSESIQGTDRKLVDIIRRNATWMLSLVNQLLDFNRIGNSKLQMKVSHMDIIGPLQDIANLFRFNADSKKIELTTYGLEDPYEMWVDADKVQKVVMNLLSNALKFTPTGGKVSLGFDVISRADAAARFPLTEADKDAQWASISVSDSGPGIPEDQLEKIFERFYQSEAGKKAAGSGIGLYYARVLCGLHHGYIRAWNRPEGGALFSLVLPVGEASYSEDERTVMVPELPSHALAENIVPDNAEEEADKKHIAVIDDDIDIANYLKVMLKPHYKVSLYYDAESALKGMEEDVPDLIISDVVMPGMDGFQLCSQIKGDLQLSHIPVVLVTAKVAVESQVQGLDKGADAYVTKPFQPAYLLALVKSLLENREKLRRQLGAATTTEDIAPEALSPRDAAFMQELYDLMEKELANADLDIVRMTEMMKISRTKFYYKVKGLTGENPSVFFKRYKLNRAADLLKEGKHNMSEIAWMTGFNTLSHFSTSFKKQFGVPPSEYVG
jgi:signal transduction histidine kinase/DNA-binding response OmpR family regulator/ligand-binding sensor domain-containing protein